MEAGKLNQRITILRPNVVTNAIGQRVDSAATTVAETWAARWQLTAKDISRQQGLQEQAEIKFLIRGRTDINTKMQVRYKGVLYQITGTEDFEDGRGLFLLVRRADV